MKKFLILLLSVCFLQTTYSQSSNVGNTKWAIGFHLDALDQFTPELDGFQSFTKPMDLGLRVSAWANINTSLAIELGVGSTGLRTGGQIEPPLNDKNLHLLNFDVGLVYKFNNGYILKENFPVAPFVFVKARGSYMEIRKNLASIDGWGVGLPIGGGINWGIQEGITLQTSVAYTFGLTDDFDNNLLWSAGFMFDIGKPNKTQEIIEPEPEEPVVLDTDGDGVIDENDNCPETAGLAKFDGCPDTDDDGIVDSSDRCPEIAGLAKFDGCADTDGDGIADPDDECPTEAGIAELNGCPNPDADGDGVNDTDDKCPTVPGLVALQGCPDADGDGVIDSEDSCPAVAGLIDNKGCPAIEEEVQEKLDFAATAIRFETGSAVIKTSSFKLLDEIVQILNDYPQYHVSIAGHTDAVGNAESNMTLSEKRAQSAASYLISKDIDFKRVSSKGFGETQPVGDNSTSAGRAMNRRVVFEMFLP